MATISGNVIFDRDRSATINSGDSGIANIPVVLQNMDTTARLAVLTDASGGYTFLNVPDGNYRIVESYGTFGGVPTPGDFSTAAAGSIPQGVNPPITAVSNPPSGTTNLDSVTPDMLLVTVTGANLTNQNFLNGPVIYTPIQTILDPCAIVLGENLIKAADNGTFGTFPPGTPANTGAPTEPYPGVTPDFTYVLPNPEIFAPMGGEYTVQNIMNNSMSANIGAWWRIADHTTGTETGRFMIVNGFDPGAVFFREVVTVQPNTNYLFTSWILNLFKVTGYPDPQLGVRVLDENGGVLYSATLGTLIPVNANAPEWKQIGSVINSRSNTSLTVEFKSEGPEVIGNDYAIDDISLNEIQVPVFNPVKTADRMAANVGEIIRYTVTLTNSCSSPLTDVFFQDTVPNGLSFVPGSVTINDIADPDADPEGGFVLPNVLGGQTVTVSFSARADEVPTPNPALNYANFTYSYTPVEGGIPGIFNVTSNEVPVEIGPLADIFVEKTAFPSPVQSGDMLTYTVTVSNAGPSAALNVVLQDDLPDAFTSAEFSTDGGATWEPFEGTVSLGNLQQGASEVVLIRGMVSPSATGSVSNTAMAGSDTPDPNLDNNTATVNTPVIPTARTADISVIKIAVPDTAVPGELLTYTVTVTNNGPDKAQNVLLYDEAPPELSNVQFSLDGGITWNPWVNPYLLEMLEAGQSRTVFIRGMVNDTACGIVSNTAVATSDTPDPNPGNNTATANTPVQTQGGANLSIKKMVCPDPAVHCQYLVYTLTIFNAGPETAKQVVITDDLPAELSNPIYSKDHCRSWHTWTGSLTIGNLQAGNNATIHVAGIVRSCAKGCIKNTAVVSSQTADPDPTNNKASVTVCICSGQ